METYLIDVDDVEFTVDCVSVEDLSGMWYDTTITDVSIVE